MSPACPPSNGNFDHITLDHSLFLISDDGSNKKNDISLTLTIIFWFLNQTQAYRGTCCATGLIKSNIVFCWGTVNNFVLLVHIPIVTKIEGPIKKIKCLVGTQRYHIFGENES